MTTNWIEEIKDKGDVINAILEWRGIYDCGKCFDEDWNQHVLPIFQQELERICDEVSKVKILDGDKKRFIDEYRSDILKIINKEIK